MNTINNFDDMIQFIKEHDLTPDQTHELVKTCINSYIVTDYKSKDELITALTDFWSKWKDTVERPLFIDLDISVKE